MRRLFVWILPLLLLAAPARPTSGGEKDEAKALNLEKLNTEADEDDPFAVDGLHLYYASNKAGTFDILLSRRAAPGQLWPAGKPVLNEKEADERSPFLYKGTLYYASNEVPDPKLADLKNFDIMSKSDPLAPFRLNGISEKTDEMHPWITPAGKEFYFSRKTDDGWTLFVARGPVPGPIGDAKPVGFPPGFHHACLSSTALVMYLQGPLEKGRTGLFRSKRSKAGAEWSMPEPLTALNHADGKRGDMSPCISPDGTRLYFASDRPGGKGGLDLWSVLTKDLHK
jgi:WD40-like Beta Propeller Repeat